MSTETRPVNEVVLLELKRHASTVEIRATDWPDGHRSVTLAFQGLRCNLPRWKIISIQAREVRAVAETLLRVADEEGWL